MSPPPVLGEWVWLCHAYNVIQKGSNPCVVYTNIFFLGLPPVSWIWPPCKSRLSPKLILFLPIENEYANALLKRSIDCKPSAHSGQIGAVELGGRKHHSPKGDRFSQRLTQGRAQEDSLKLGQGNKRTWEPGNSTTKSDSWCGWVSTSPDHSWRTLPIIAQGPRNTKWSLWLPPTMGIKQEPWACGSIVGCEYAVGLLLQSTVNREQSWVVGKVTLWLWSTVH